jgi:hypothetical protein
MYVYIKTGRTGVLKLWWTERSPCSEKIAQVKPTRAVLSSSSYATMRRGEWHWLSYTCQQESLLVDILDTRGQQTHFGSKSLCCPPCLSLPALRLCQWWSHVTDQFHAGKSTGSPKCCHWQVLDTGNFSLEPISKQQHWAWNRCVRCSSKKEPRPAGGFWHFAKTKTDCFMFAFHVQDQLIG